MTFAERGSEHGDAVFDAVLLGHQHIGVAFHDDRAAFIFEVIACDIERVQLTTFGEERRFGRVDVFGRSLIC